MNNKIEYILTLEPEKYMCLAKELCADLNNKFHYIAISLKEIQHTFHLTMYEVEDLEGYEESTQVYWCDRDEIYEKYGYRIKADEENFYTPHVNMKDNVVNLHFKLNK